jgi:hypothetical protein
LNVTHAFLTCRELLPVLVANGGGSVILTASHTAWIAKPDLIAYNSTKAALVGLTRGLAEAYEFAEKPPRKASFPQGQADFLLNSADRCLAGPQKARIRHF